MIGLIGLLLVSCNAKKGFRIEGTLNGGAGKTVQLDILKVNHLEPLDSAKVDGKNHFALSGELEQPSFAIFHTTRKNYITMILKPGDRITINGSFSDIEKNHTVEGSEDTRLFEEYVSHMQKNIEQLQQLDKIYKNSLNSPDFQKVMQDLDSRSRKILDEQKTYSEKFVTDHLNSLASLLVLYQQIAPGRYVLDPMKDFPYFEKVDSALTQLYPESDPVITFHTQMAELRTRKKKMEIQNKLFGIGVTAPDIALPSPDGDTIHLSSLRGKIVLLDFWAAWCSPCRIENPNLVKDYNKYHNKGFEIFQVSLDRDRKNWLKGIRDDHLGRWIHVSDLGYWQSSVVKQYHIQGIPKNFLLDKDGKIIAKDLRGEALSRKLAEVFK